MKKSNWFIVAGLMPVLLVFLFIGVFFIDSTSGAAPEITNSTQPQVAQEEKKKEKAPEEQVEVPDSNEPFTIAFAGDTMFDWDLKPVLEEKGYDYPFEHVKKDLQQADYTVVNLETAITERTQKTEGQLFWIKSEERSLKALKNSGVDMVNLGNNHMLDYGTEGLLDTIDAVEKNGLTYMGAGRDETEAYQANTIEINNQTVAFISFTRFYPSPNWAVNGDRPGVTSGYDLNFVIDKINKEQQKAMADYFVVNFHWGVEKTNTPAAYQRDYVKRIVEETETDAIIGAHPHWLQGFEFYQDVPVAYSLGNFLFPDYVSGHAAETGVYNLTFDNGKISASFNPYVIKNNQIQPLTGDKQQAIYQYLDDISINASLDQNGNITQKN